MDAHHFDDLARSLADHLPRRHVLGIIGALALGHRLAGPPDEAVARVCRVVGERCGKGIKGNCCAGTTCRRRKSGRGTCACRAGLTECNGSCFDIANDPLGCGPACRTCPKDTDCCNGACCPAGQRCCGGICTDLTTDDANCGGCTQACPQDLTCCDSRCRVLAADPRHCGACGHACPATYICRDGQCVCPNGWQACGGVCRNVQEDHVNCGQCGVVCSPLRRCQGGQCVCGREGVTCLEPWNPGTICGLPENHRCIENIDCCSGSCDQDPGLSEERFCAPCQGRYCGGDGRCCGGFACTPRQRDETKWCGGCAGDDYDCATNDECCYSDCTPRSPSNPDAGRMTCLSLQGGPCVQNHDCRACGEHRNCVNACVDGRCRI